jgi:hypothetical protein
LRTWLTPNQAELDAHEAQVLANINAALARWSMPPLARVAELYPKLKSLVVRQRT